MKKFSILSIMMLFAVVGFSQFTFGPKAAVNFSKFSLNTDELKSNLKPGFDAGLFARLSISKFYVQPELQYSFRSTDFNEIHDELTNIKSSSIDVPILAGYKIMDIKAVNIRAFVGPRFSFVVSDNFADSFNSAKFNFAGQAGLGVDVLMFTLDFRYDWTFTKTAEVRHENLRFNTFLISLGWKIL